MTSSGSQQRTTRTRVAHRRRGLRLLLIAGAVVTMSSFMQPLTVGAVQPAAPETPEPPTTPPVEEPTTTAAPAPTEVTTTEAPPTTPAEPSTTTPVEPTTSFPIPTTVPRHRCRSRRPRRPPWCRSWTSRSSSLCTSVEDFEAGSAHVPCRQQQRSAGRGHAAERRHRRVSQRDGAAWAIDVGRPRRRRGEHDQVDRRRPGRDGGLDEPGLFGCCTATPSATRRAARPRSRGRSATTTDRRRSSSVTRAAWTSTPTRRADTARRSASRSSTDRRRTSRSPRRSRSSLPTGAPRSTAPRSRPPRARDRLHCPTCRSRSRRPPARQRRPSATPSTTCYCGQNTSDVPLEVVRLVDDRLGVVIELPDVETVVAPGESLCNTDLGLPVELHGDARATSARRSSTTPSSPCARRSDARGCSRRPRRPRSTSRSPPLLIAVLAGDDKTWVCHRT